MSEDKAITIIETDGSAAIMPAVSADVLLDRYHTIAQIRETVMVAGVDYGPPFPGSDKPTLLKPGAEKLCTAFALYNELEALDAPDFNQLGKQLGEGGVPFFIYRYRCTLYSRDGQYRVGSGIGSCNSWEKKYRYRTAERICPECGQAAIIKGKAEFGGGWLCFKKKGGCGYKYEDRDTRITNQQAGVVENEDIAEVINTIDKIAQKRGLIAATLIAVGASNLFTQDEDLVEATYTRIENVPAVQRAVEQSIADGPPNGDVIIGEHEEEPQPGDMTPKQAAYFLPDPDIAVCELDGTAYYNIEHYGPIYLGLNAKHFRNRWMDRFNTRMLGNIQVSVRDFFEIMAQPSKSEQVEAA